MQIVSIGEVLWDLISGKEHLGGAPFNVCAHVVPLGHQAVFVSAVGDDDRGRRILEEAGRHHIDTNYITVTDKASTGVSEIVLDEKGHARHRLPRPAAYDFVELSDSQRSKIGEAAPDWLYFGTLLQTSEAAQRQTRLLIDACPAAKRFYDVNLRVNSYTPDLVKELLLLADIAKLNEDEAQEIASSMSLPQPDLEAISRELASRFRLQAVCITRDENGCVIFDQQNDSFIAAPGFPIKVVDTVGAGDAFSAAFLHGWNEQWPVSEIADFANRTGALIASKEGATPAWSIEEARALKAL